MGFEYAPFKYRTCDRQSTDSPFLRSRCSQRPRQYTTFPWELERTFRHKAPGDALIFALDGGATIGYEGAEFHIKSGEQFHFAKGGLHSVQTSERFKMALLLVLD